MTIQNKPDINEVLRPSIRINAKTSKTDKNILMVSQKNFNEANRGARKPSLFGSNSISFIREGGFSKAITRIFGKIFPTDKYKEEYVLFHAGRESLSKAQYQTLEKFTKNNPKLTALEFKENHLSYLYTHKKEIYDTLMAMQPNTRQVYMDIKSGNNNCEIMNGLNAEFKKNPKYTSQEIVASIVNYINNNTDISKDDLATVNGKNNFLSLIQNELKDIPVGRLKASQLIKNFFIDNQNS